MQKCKNWKKEKLETGKTQENEDDRKKREKEKILKNFSKNL